MTDKIKRERLIELAEGKLSPTAEEQMLLAGDKTLRGELSELRTLFAELRGLPEPEIDETALAGLLPALRGQIENRRTHPPLAWLQLKPALARAAAAAASLAILVGLSVFIGVDTAPRPVPGDPYLEFAAEPDLIEAGEEASDLLIMASGIPDLDLFPEIEESLVGGSAEPFIDESRMALMEMALADDSTLATLESEVRTDRERYEIIRAILSSLES